MWHAVQNRTFFAREAEQFVQAVRAKAKTAGVTPADALQTIELDPGGLPVQPVGLVCGSVERRRGRPGAAGEAV